jgi:hypothetical protein
LKIQDKHVILRDLKNDIKYKLHRLVILGGVSFKINGLVHNPKVKTKNFEKFKKFRVLVPNCALK